MRRSIREREWSKSDDIIVIDLSVEGMDEESKLAIYGSIEETSLKTDVDEDSILTQLKDDKGQFPKFIISGYMFMRPGCFLQLKKALAVDVPRRIVSLSKANYRTHSELKDVELNIETEVLNLSSGMINKFASLKAALRYYDDSFYDVLKVPVSMDKDCLEGFIQPLYFVNGKIYKATNDNRRWDSFLDSDVVKFCSLLVDEIGSKVNGLPWNHPANVASAVEQMDATIKEDRLSSPVPLEGDDTMTCLLELEGDDILEALNVTKDLYTDKKAARRWYRSVKRKIDTRYLDSGIALRNLDKIYFKLHKRP